jgi:GntR family transcriptional regulator
MTDQPPYLAAAEDLATHIAAMPPGTRLPSEAEIAAEYGINRHTARAALAELERRYLVNRVAGSGSYVVRRLDLRVSPTEPPSWSEAVRRAGGTPRVELESVETVRPNVAVRRALSLRSDQRVHRISRRRLIGDAVVGCADSYLIAAVTPGLPELLMPEASLYATLRDHYGVQLARSGFRAELELASDDVCRRLGAAGRPWVIAAVGLHDDAHTSTAVEAVWGWLRADVFNIVVEFGESLEFLTTSPSIKANSTGGAALESAFGWAPVARRRTHAR